MKTANFDTKSRKNKSEVRWDFLRKNTFWYIKKNGNLTSTNDSGIAYKIYVILTYKFIQRKKKEK